MKSTVLVDTGPLIALFNRNDKHHSWSFRHFREFKPPLITCDAVLAEALYILRRDPAAVPFILGLVEKDVIVSSFSISKNAFAVRKLMTKYKDTPMDFADACVVRMTELMGDCRVWTVDSDFKVYRRNGRAIIPLIFPD